MTQGVGGYEPSGLPVGRCPGNRAAIVDGAPLGGLLADAAGYRTALWVGVAEVAGSALALLLSPFRHAREPAAD